jgi:hypothetical protein
VAGSEAQAEVQADGEGGGLAAVVMQRATLEVVTVGPTECWRKLEIWSVQMAAQEAGGRQRRRSAIKDGFGGGVGQSNERGGL